MLGEGHASVGEVLGEVSHADFEKGVVAEIRWCDWGFGVEGADLQDFHPFFILYNQKTDKNVVF